MNLRDAFLRAAAKAPEQDLSKLRTHIEALDCALRACDLAAEVEGRLSAVAANGKGNVQAVCDKLNAELAWLDWAREDIGRQSDAARKLTVSDVARSPELLVMVRRVATECAAAEAELAAQVTAAWRPLAAVEQGAYLAAKSEPLRASVQRLKDEARLAQCDLGYARDANAAQATLDECQRAVTTKQAELERAEAALRELPPPPALALRFVPQ